MYRKMCIKIKRVDSLWYKYKSIFLIFANIDIQISSRIFIEPLSNKANMCLLYILNVTLKLYIAHVYLH